MRAASQEILALKEEVADLRSQLESLRGDRNARLVDNGKARHVDAAPVSGAE